MAFVTDALFREDAYLAEAEAAVVHVNERGGIILDRTVFYATSGGQPGDTGRLTLSDGRTVEIAATVTGETKDEIIHVPASEAGLARGDRVKLAIDMERRLKLMRMHTACHLRTEISEREAVRFRVGFVRIDKTVAQLTFVSAPRDDIAGPRFQALVQRAGDRLRELDS